MKTAAIIIDIDGTLANIEHRRHLLDGEKKHWSEFFNQMKSDTLNFWCRDIIEHFSFDTKTLLVSGRPDNFRSTTGGWLKDNLVGYEKLLMRKEGDYRPDYEIKKEIYLNEIEPFYNVLFVVDDRSSVVKMWRELGLVCLQCAEGNY